MPIFIRFALFICLFLLDFLSFINAHNTCVYINKIVNCKHWKFYMKIDLTRFELENLKIYNRFNQHIFHQCPSLTCKNKMYTTTTVTILQGHISTSI